MAIVELKDLYWFAGMVEGEGSFYTYTKRNLSKRNLTYPEMTVQTTDYDVAMRMANITGCYLSRVKPYNSSKLPSYKIRMCSTRCVQWMMTLYPLMGIRRKAKIREVLDIWRVSVDGRKTRYSK